MNKNEIQKVHSFIDEVKALPDELLTNEDTNAFTKDGKTEADQQKVYAKERQLFETVKDIKIRLLAYFRAVSGENSTYIDLLGGITFKPKLFVYNTIHFENNKAWLDDKTKLLNLLKMAKAEFEEKSRIAEENKENSLLHFLKSKEAKAIILTALLTIITGIATKDFWFDNIFSKPTTTKIVVSQTDSLVAADKTNVINKTVNEVFTNYSEAIQTLQNRYAPTSAISYLDEYVKKETENIETRIANRSYVHRFSSNEKLWTETDFTEVASLSRARTINRMKEFIQDMESKSQGPFIFSDDKLMQLRDLARREIIDNKK